MRIGEIEMNILFLMGKDKLQKLDDNFPTYMTEINQKTIIEILIDFAKSINPDKAIFCIKNEDINNFYLDKIIKMRIENAVIIKINNETKGAVCTSMLASEFIDNNDELLITSINDFTDRNWNTILDYFRANDFDAGIVSFNSIHPRYSFAKLNENEEVIEITEKKPSSSNALVSFYYFKHGKEYIECSKNIIRKDAAINDSFYISQTINEMILKQNKIGLYRIANSEFHLLKTEAQLSEYSLELKAQTEEK